MAKKRTGNNEILKDYLMLESISKQLNVHERILHNVIAKAVAKKSKNTLEDGILENLDIVTKHMRNAQKEIESARKKLKMI